MNTGGFQVQSLSYAPVPGVPLPLPDATVPQGAPGQAKQAEPPFRHSADVTFRLPLLCDLSAVRNAVLTIRDFLHAQHVRGEDLLACELALVEACNNAVIYADERGRGKAVELEALCNGSRIELHVIDHTPGFVWPERFGLPEIDAEHGRGIFIIQSLMTETFYLRGHTENRLVMRRTRNREHKDESKTSALIGDIHQNLASNAQVLSNMTKELCLHAADSCFQAELVDGRLAAHELEIARQIQQSLLPKSFPILPGFGLSGFCLSARQVGGDFYDVLPLPQGCALLMVADVMGKGVPAALFAATLRTLVRTMSEWTHSPSDLLARMNRLLYDELSGVDMFITAQTVLVDPRQRRLTVANAGHCPLLVTDALGTLRSVSPDGMPLGILPEVAFSEEVVPLEPLACALLYTDGMTDAQNSDGDFFGHDRLESWFAKAAREFSTAADMKENCLAELKRFQSHLPPRDDQTFLILAEEGPRDGLILPVSSTGPPKVSDAPILTLEEPELKPCVISG